MPRSRLYQIRIPLVVRHLFGGADRLRQRFADHGLAEIWLTDRRNEIERAVVAHRHGIEAGLAQVETAEDVTLADAAGSWIEDRPLAPRTRKMYRQHLQPHLIKPLGKLPLSSIGRARLTAHLANRLRAGASNLSAGRDVMFVQAIVRYAAEMGWRTDASALLVKRPKAQPQKTRRWDPKALEKAIRQLEPADRAVAEVALATGMRAAELRGMQVEWINWRAGVILVPSDASHRTKSGKARPLPLHARLRSVLRAWLDGRTTGPVFPPLRSRGNGEAKGRDMRVVAAKLKALAGIAVATGLHDLRHAYLSGLAARGLPVDELRDLAGHSSIVVTERYMHSAPGRLDRARRLLNRRPDTRVDTRKRSTGTKG